jgi:hypothetical protein
VSNFTYPRLTTLGKKQGDMTSFSVAREYLGDFQGACRYFDVSFPATLCPPIFHKQNMLLNVLRIDASLE